MGISDEKFKEELDKVRELIFQHSSNLTEEGYSSKIVVASLLETAVAIAFASAPDKESAHAYVQGCLEILMKHINIAIKDGII